MCLLPTNEQDSAMDDTMGNVIATDPVQALLDAMRDAEPYVTVNTMHARKHAKAAGLTNMPEFDPYARVLANLRNALAVVMSPNRVHGAPQ